MFLKSVESRLVTLDRRNSCTVESAAAECQMNCFDTTSQNVRCPPAAATRARICDGSVSGTLSGL